MASKDVNFISKSISDRRFPIDRITIYYSTDSNLIIRLHGKLPNRPDFSSDFTACSRLQESRQLTVWDHTKVSLSLPLRPISFYEYVSMSAYRETWGTQSRRQECDYRTVGERSSLTNFTCGLISLNENRRLRTGDFDGL